MNRTALSLTLFFCPGLALADVTPQDVWDTMTASYSAVGMTTTATVTPDGAALVVTDNGAAATLPMGAGEISVTLPDLRLEPLGDGTVAVITPDSYLMTLTLNATQAPGPVTLDIAYAEQGADTIASGTPGDVTFTDEVQSLSMLINNLVIPDEADMEFQMEFEADGYAGTTRITTGDLTTIASEMTNGEARTRVSIEGFGTRQESTSTGSAGRTVSTIALPQGMNLLDLTPALKAGLSVEMTTDIGPSSGTTLTYISDQLTGQQEQSIGPSTTTLRIDADGVSVMGEAGAFDVLFRDDTVMPFPISVSGAGASANILMPLLAREEAQKARYAFALNDLTVSDEIWAMADPSGALDRSPIDIGLDLGADLVWGLDVLNIPALIEMGESGMPPPILPQSIDLNLLNIAALGAVISGSGAFTVDMMDMTTFAGMPRPEGKATVTASGLNAAIDQLVAAGLLPEDQAGMSRMMMGMFARTTGDDQLETSVEINAQGHVLVNGQRMR